MSPREQGPYAPPIAPLVDEATYEERLEAFRRSVPVTPAVATRYIQQVRLLEAHIRPRPLLSASPQDVARVRDELLNRWGHLLTFKPHTKTPGVHACDAGLFQRAHDARAGSTIPVVTQPGERPSFCASTCGQYKFSPFPASVFLIAVKRFFDHHEDEVPRNPARKLLREFLQEYDLDEHLDERYCPTLDGVVQLVRRARDPRGKALLIVLAKTGRRIDEVRLLTWNDIHWEEGWIDLSRVRAEKRRAAGRGRTKMRAGGFRAAFMGAELTAALQQYRTHYWLPTSAKDEAGVPLTESLWLDRTRSTTAKRGSLQGWVDAALKDAGMWDTHGQDADDRLTPHSFRHFFTTILQSGANPAPASS